MLPYLFNAKVKFSTKEMMWRKLRLKDEEFEVEDEQ